MSINAWRFTAVMLGALTMGMAFCHLMEMPARLSWDQSLWVQTTVIGGLYRMFGTLGAFITVGAVLATIVLAVMMRRRETVAFRLTAAAACLYALAFALWWAIVFPVNLQLAAWVSGPVPPDWAAWRLRWETGHAINAVLMIVGLGLLVWSLIRQVAKARA